MPITKELKNIKKFESAGFTHDQAETLTGVIEESHADSQESLKEFIHNEINGLRNEVNGIHNEINGLRNEVNGIHNEVNGIRNEIKSDFDVKLGALETRLMVSQKDLLIKLFGIIVGTVGLAVTILKLF